MIDRKQLQQKAYKIYSGNYKGFVNQLLGQRHIEQLATAYSVHNNPTHNALRRIANLQSVLYVKPPRRISEDENLNTFLKNGIVNLNETLEEVSKLTYSVSDWFVCPYWHETKVYLDLVEPWLVEIEEDRGRVISYTIPYSDGSKVKWFSDGNFEEYNKKGKLIKKEDSGLGIAPVVWFRLFPASISEKWGIYRNQDLINGTLEIGVRESYFALNSYLRSFNAISVDEDGQTAATDTDQIITPLNILGVKLTATELASKGTEYAQEIEKLELDLAASRGISPIVYLAGRTSSDQATVTTFEKRQNWEKQVNLFSNPEKQLLRVAMALSNKNAKTKFDLNSDILIDYIDPGIDEGDRKQSQENLEKALQLGIDNIPDYLMRTNPDIPNRDFAISLYEENIEQSAKHIIKMRELNKPKELPKDEIPLSPEENGKLGGQSKGKSDEEKEALKEQIKEESGGNGPLLTPKQFKKKL